MAIYEIGKEYQVQLWYIKNSGQSSTFTAVETPPHLVDKLSGKWIENYFEWKSKQTEIAQQPDEDSSYALAGEQTSSSGTQGGGTNPGIPGGPPSGPSGPGGPSGPSGFSHSSGSWRVIRAPKGRMAPDNSPIVGRLGEVSVLLRVA